jgi:hypothetical protein
MARIDKHKADTPQWQLDSALAAPLFALLFTPLPTLPP